jgi:hypothetical protein
MWTARTGQLTEHGQACARAAEALVRSAASIAEVPRPAAGSQLVLLYAKCNNPREQSIDRRGREKKRGAAAGPSLHFRVFGAAIQARKP